MMRVLITPEERARRQAICDACEHRRGPLCRQCKCVIAVKTRLAASQCPLNKWAAVNRFGIDDLGLTIEEELTPQNGELEV